MVKSERKMQGALSKVDKKIELNRGVDTHVRRKSPLYGNRVLNHNVVIIKLIATYVL